MNDTAMPRKVSQSRVRLYVFVWIAACMGAICCPRVQAGPGGELPEAEIRPYQKVYALCIGINDYGQSEAFGDLRYAVNDAKQVHRRFIENYGYEAILLTDAEATREGILEAIRRMTAKAGRDDVVIVYYSGHGHTVNYVQNEIDEWASYLVPADARITPDQINNRDAFDQQAVPGSGLMVPIRESQAKHKLVVLDCCVSGMLVATRSASGIAATDGAADTDIFIGLRDRSALAMTAGVSRQKSYEFPPGTDTQHGIFTYHFLQQLDKNPVIPARTMTTKIAGGVRQTVTELGFTKQVMTPRAKDIADEIGDFAFVRQPDEAWFTSAWQGLGEMTSSETQAGSSGKGIQGKERDAPPSFAQEDVVAFQQAGQRSRTLNISLTEDPYWQDRYTAVQKAAVQGDTYAMACLFHCYANGIGVAHDEPQAFQWARESRESGNRSGSIAVAQAYLTAVGVQRNEKAAEHLVREIGSQSPEMQALSGAFFLASAIDENDKLGIAMGTTQLAIKLFDVQKIDPGKLIDHANKNFDGLWVQGHQRFIDRQAFETQRKALLQVLQGDLRTSIRHAKDWIPDPAERQTLDNACRDAIRLLTQLRGAGRNSDSGNKIKQVLFEAEASMAVLNRYFTTKAEN